MAVSHTVEATRAEPPTDLVGAATNDPGVRNGHGIALTEVTGACIDLACLVAASRVFELWNRTTLPFVFVSWLLLARGWRRRRRLVWSVSHDLSTVISAVGAGTLVAALVVIQMPWVAASLLNAAVLAVVLLVMSRALWYWIAQQMRRVGDVSEPTIIVGAGDASVRFAKAIERKPELGLEVVGFVDSQRSDDELPAPLLGDVDELLSLIWEHEVHHVIVAFPKIGDRALVQKLRQLRELPVQVHSVERLFEFMPAEPIIVDIDGYPVTSFAAPVNDYMSRMIKRFFDLVIACLLIVLTLPAIALCALAVRVSSPGPVLFKQTRLGHFGRAFEILKFRTMEVNCDSDTTWTVERDPRVTAVGRILRPTHLDELPQLWNVMRGDMSLVGPRPERPVFVDRYRVSVESYDDRHRAPSGLTGWAQVNGYWGDTCIEERARLDNRYIDSWSLRRDIKILVRTIPTLFRRSG